ncbi:MAG TPA: YqeG family HAD IIIA-type phosphatase [Negativicutes bacterium]
MYNLLCPRVRVNSLYEIKLDVLQQNGIRGIIFDLDNTIIPWDSPSMQPEVMQWLEGVLAQGFKICLVSNNMGQRVQDIAAVLAVPFVARAYKPAKNGFRQAVKIMSLAAHEVAVVGDQLFTDMLGGNRLGLFTIWVTPLSSREFIGTRFTRQVEKLAVRILRAKGLMR